MIMAWRSPERVHSYENLLGWNNSSLLAVLLISPLYTHNRPAYG